MFLPWVRDYQTITLQVLHQPSGLKPLPLMLLPTTHMDQWVRGFSLLQRHPSYPKQTILLGLLGNCHRGEAWNMQLVRGPEVCASSSWNHNILQPRASAWWYQARPSSCNMGSVAVHKAHTATGIQSLSAAIAWAEVNYQRKHQLLSLLCWSEKKI